MGCSFIAHLSKGGPDLVKDMKVIFAQKWRVEQFRSVALRSLVTSKPAFVLRTETWREKWNKSFVGSISLKRSNRWFMVGVLPDNEVDYKMTISLEEFRGGTFTLPAECSSTEEASVTVCYDVQKHATDLIVRESKGLESAS